METQYQKAIVEMERFQDKELSILRLADPILASPSNTQKRTSDASADASDNPSPASLNEDLSHYKELFSKLRFSYIEQVTKEKFLRAIVGEPPQIVEHQENVELEQTLVGAKAELKAQKTAVATVVGELEAQARQLSERYENIEAQKSQLSRLPGENKVLEQRIALLRSGQPDSTTNPSLSLPLHATQELLEARQAELEGLEKRLKALQQTLPRKSRELEILENELRPLELQRAGTIAAAEEARQRREGTEKGHGDDLELKGRWYRNVDVVLKDILQAEA